MSTIGLALSLNTLSNCNFVTVPNEDVDMKDIFSAGMHFQRGFGLTTYEMYDMCYEYRSDGLLNRFPDGLGSMHIAATVFAILAVTFGTVAMIISWCISCIACDIRFVKGLGVSYGCIMIFQVLAFLFFGSNLCQKHKCSFSGGAGVNIAAIVFWAAASISSFRLPPFDEVAEGATNTVLPITSPPPKNVAEKITEIINADGTKEIRREVLNPDGSKVVETTKIGKGAEIDGVSEAMKIAEA